jgi:hypothetical protein
VVPAVGRQGGQGGALVSFAGDPSAEAGEGLVGRTGESRVRRSTPSGSRALAVPRAGQLQHDEDRKTRGYPRRQVDPPLTPRMHGPRRRLRPLRGSSLGALATMRAVGPA